jgi:FG-GAP-like repeat
MIRTGIARAGLLSMGLLLAWAGAGRAAQGPAFDSGGRSLDLPPTPRPRNALADLDGDGALDLVSRVAYGFVVRMGDGSGGFVTPPVSYLHPYSPAQLRILDLDADLHPDVLLVEDGYSLWWRGRGDGTFEDAMDLARFSSPGDDPVFAAGNVDDDPLPDLIYGGSSGVSIHRNLAGPDPDSLGYTYIGGQVKGLGISDLDGDGVRDIVVATTNDWGDLRGLGGGAFDAYSVLGARGGSLFVVDFDHDGIPDVISGGSIFRGTGGGVFAFADSLGYEPAAVEDVDGDGWSDLVRFDADAMEVRYGGAPGGFSAPIAYTTGSLPTTVTFGDVDADGVVDAVVGCASSSIVTTLFGLAPRGFRSPEPFHAGAGPVAIVAGEFSGDSWPDVVTANRGDHTVTLLRGVGANRFGAPEVLSTPAGVAALLAVDLDGNGRLDLVAACDSTGIVSVFPGLAGGGFGARSDLIVGGAPARLALGDLDEDGTPDMVVLDGSHSRLHVLPGDGSGGFGTPRDYDVDNAWEIALLDADHDGHLDVAYLHREGSILSTRVRVLLGDGDGHLTPSPFAGLGVLGGRGWFAVGDVDEDGWDDLCVAIRLDSLTSVTGSLSALFTAAGWQPADSIGPSITGIRLADIDGDGHLDALTSSDHANAVTVRYGRGDGTFGPRFDHLACAGAADLALADFDGDGDLDVAVAGARSDGVVVLENLTPTAPTAVRASLVSATADHDGVHIEWLVQQAPRDLLVERSEATAAWQPAGGVMFDVTGRVRFVDELVEPGRRYGYRLVIDGVQSAGEVWLDVPAAQKFALHGASPNPARARVRVSFSLPNDDPARLELWDVAGRRVRSEAVGALGAGPHLKTLAGPPLAPGAYVIRLVRGGEVATRRLVVVR